MSMDCETCDALLIDLVERELDEAKAAEVRAHASSCESCGHALARLEGGRRAAAELVRVAPPKLDAVLAAARAHVQAQAAEKARASEPSPVQAALPSSPPPAEPTEGLFDQIVRWLGSWAARPQVAMATMLLLMVGIGLWYVPQLRWQDRADPDGTIVEPDVHAEVGSPALVPAEPLDLDLDPRSRRVALGTGADEEVPAAPQGDERPHTEIAATERPTHRSEAEPTAPPSLADEGSEAVAVMEIAPSTAVGRVEDGPLPDTTTPTTESAIVAQAETSRVAVAPTRPSAPAPTASSSPRSLQEGMARPDLPTADGLMPTAIYRQAQAQATSGHCDQAAPRLRALLAEHPEFADAPRAMLTLAECERRMGHLDRADSLLAQAEGYPSVSGEARRARARVQTAMRAAQGVQLDMEAADHATSTQRATTAPAETSGY
jgi:hypothetical protein